MTAGDRNELMSRLSELQSLCPDMRLGQLIANMAVVARGTEPSAIWEMEDDELLAAVMWQLEQLEGRRVEVA